MEKVSFFFFLSKQRQAQGEHGGGGGMRIEYMERIMKRKEEKEKDLILSWKILNT